MKNNALSIGKQITEIVAGIAATGTRLAPAALRHAIRTLQRVRGGRGVSRVAVLLALVALAAAAFGGVAARQLNMSREEMYRWQARQQQIESILSQGYEDVENGSAVLQRYKMTWTVSEGTGAKEVELIIESDDFEIDADTVYMFITR